MTRHLVLMLVLVCVTFANQDLNLDEDQICDPPHGILIEWQDVCTALCQKWHDGVNRWLYTREVAVGKPCGPGNRGHCRKINLPRDEFIIGRLGECFHK